MNYWESIFWLIFSIGILGILILFLISFFVLYLKVKQVKIKFIKPSHSTKQKSIEKQNKKYFTKMDKLLKNK